jgi:amino-acid N-acetyltransferase
MNTEPSSLTFAQQKDEEAIHALLAASGLPHEDISAHIHNFLLLFCGETLAGCVGLELYEDENVVLLRSLAVADAYRGQGLAKILSDEIINLARHLGAKDVYLLTQTGEHFFIKRGFVRWPRDQAPGAIRTSLQFTSLCPSTAILMRLGL